MTDRQIGSVCVGHLDESPDACVFCEVEELRARLVDQHESITDDRDEADDELGAALQERDQWRRKAEDAQERIEQLEDKLEMTRAAREQAESRAESLAHDRDEGWRRAHAAEARLDG